MDFDLSKLIAANYTFLVVLILILMASGCAEELPVCPPPEYYKDRADSELTPDEKFCQLNDPLSDRLGITGLTLCRGTTEFCNEQIERSRQ